MPLELLVAFVAGDDFEPRGPGRDIRGLAKMIPDGTKGQGLALLQQRQSARVVAALFVLPQSGRGLEERHEQRFLQGPCADDPGGDAIDAGVKVVEPDAYARHKIAAHDFVGNCPQVVRQDHHMIAIPPHAATDMQQNLRQPHQDRGDLIGDSFGRMKVARIEAEQLAIGEGIGQVEFMRSDDIAFRTEAEQFAFHRVEIPSLVDRLGENFVERFSQSFARAAAIDRRVFIAVGNPDVRHTARAKLLAKRFANFPAGDAMSDPESPNAFVLAGQGKAGIGLRVGEERWIKIESQATGFGPIDPAGKVLGRELIPLDASATILSIDRMQIQSMPAGNQSQGRFQVTAKLVNVPRPPWIIARRLNAATGKSRFAFESADIVALPAMQ